MGHKGNRIYYTDDDFGGDKVYICSGHDMGVFNLESSGFEILCLADSDCNEATSNMDYSDTVVAPRLCTLNF